MVPGGIFATYYAGVSATYYNDPLKCAMVASVSDSSGIRSTLTVPAADAYTVRWSSLFRPRETTTHTFTPTGLLSADRVRLWLDTKLLIDQWHSLASISPAATLSFPLADEYYDLEMYYRSSQASSSFSLNVASSSLTNPATIDSSRLYMSSHVVGSPFTVTTMPAATDFSASIIYGEGLTIATAGVPASFTVQVKDSFLNLRKQGGDNIESQLASVGSGLLGRFVAMHEGKAKLRIIFLCNRRV